MASLALAACSGKTESSGGGGAGGSVSAGAGGGVGGICALPADPGPCDAAMPRFWFDAASGKCKQFIYGGCQGNANNFKSPDECVKACSPSTAAACDAVACETGTQCLYASAPEFLATCAAPCGGGTSCPPGQTCSCGASCPGCKNCIQACMPL